MAFIPLSSATTNHPQYMTSIPKNTSNDTWKISKGSRYFDELSITLASPSDQLGPSTSLQNGRLSPFLRPERYRQRKPIVCNSPLQPMQRNSQSPSINGPIDLAEDMSNLPNSNDFLNYKSYIPSCWSCFTFLITCCIPNLFLSICCMKKGKLVQQALRENVQHPLS